MLFFCKMNLYCKVEEKHVIFLRRKMIFFFFFKFHFLNTNVTLAFLTHKPDSGL